jgi:hypothetical protein
MHYSCIMFCFFQPWDVTELCIGKLTPDGRGLTNITVVAGTNSHDCGSWFGSM